MDPADENQINQIFTVDEENRKEKCWTPSREICGRRWKCQKRTSSSYYFQRYHVCSYQIVFLVDITQWEEPPCIMFENAEHGIGWITLKNNINVFCWCCNTNEVLQILKTTKYISGIRQNLIYSSKTILYPSQNTHWITYNLHKYRSAQVKNKAVPDTVPYDTVNGKFSSNKNHRIQEINIVCKYNNPPSLFLLSKLAYLTNYMIGPKYDKCLSTHFRIASKIVPKNYGLDLCSVSMRQLKTKFEDTKYFFDSPFYFKLIHNS